MSKFRIFFFHFLISFLCLNFAFTKPYSYSKNVDNFTYIWHITDVHIDELYVQNSDPINCNHEGTCCREFSEHQTHFAGKFGSFEGDGYCGLPVISLEGTMDFVNDESKRMGLQPDGFYVVYTGDQSGQDEETQTVEENANALKVVYEMLYRKFYSRVFPSIGNHDNYPCQQHDVHSSFLELNVEAWKPWLNEEELESVREHGYYTTMINDKLRLISLNTNWNSNRNYWMALHPQKRMEMLDWLRDILLVCDTNKEKVLLIGHVPPGFCGSVGCKTYNFYEYENDFSELIKKYKHIIITYLVGHEHVNRFGLITAPGSTEGLLTYFAGGSVLNSEGEGPFFKVNPSVSLYILDNEKEFELIDVKIFYNNLTYSNELLNFKKGWNHLLSYKKDYIMNDLSLISFENLIKRFESDSKLYDKFMMYYTANYKNEKECDVKCKRHLLCQISVTNHDQFEGCLNF